MGIKEVMKHAFLQGYATSNIDVTTVIVCILCTLVLALYIYSVYKYINRNAVYNKNFNLAVLVIAIITSAIILTIQSNIVVSLGMVGALSIVRFRTAIKDPMDLVFLFWSISVGIICGAGFVLIAILASIVITIVIAVVSASPIVKGSLILVINADSYTKENVILEIVEQSTNYMKVRSRNASKHSLNMAIEVKLKENEDLLANILKLDCVQNASLVEHDGNVTM